MKPLGKCEKNCAVQKYDKNKKIRFWGEHWIRPKNGVLSEKTTEVLGDTNLGLSLLKKSWAVRKSFRIREFNPISCWLTFEDLQERW